MRVETIKFSKNVVRNGRENKSFRTLVEKVETRRFFVETVET